MFDLDIHCVTTFWSERQDLQYTSSPLQTNSLRTILKDNEDFSFRRFFSFQWRIWKSFKNKHFLTFIGYKQNKQTIKEKLIFSSREIFQTIMHWFYQVLKPNFMLDKDQCEWHCNPGAYSPFKFHEYNRTNMSTQTILRTRI